MVLMSILLLSVILVSQHICNGACLLRSK